MTIILGIFAPSMILTPYSKMILQMHLDKFGYRKMEFDGYFIFGFCVAKIQRDI